MPPTVRGWRSIVSCFGRRYLSAVLLTLATASHLEAQSEFQMLVNFGKGWKESGDFNNLEGCKKGAAAFAAKYSVQAGCATVSALDKWRADEKYLELAARCAQQSDVKISSRQGTYFTIFGTAPDRSAFELCMAESRLPTR